jgi:DNA primase
VRSPRASAKTHNHAYTDRVTGANPELAPQVPSLAGLNHEKLPGLGLFSELVNTCLSQPGLTTGQLLEHYRG